MQNDHKHLRPSPFIEMLARWLRPTPEADAPLRAHPHGRLNIKRLRRNRAAAKLARRQRVAQGMARRGKR